MTVSKNLRPRHSPEVKNKILELKLAGTSDKYIAISLNVKFNYIRKVLRNNPEVRSTKEQYNNNRIIARRKNAPFYEKGTTEKILELYYKGTKRADIALALNIDINKVISDIQLHADRRLTKEQRANINTHPRSPGSIENQNKTILNKFNIKYKAERYILKAELFNGKYLDKDDLSVNDHALWECQKGHQWKALISNVLNQDTWCPYCTDGAPSRAQQEIFNFVKELNVGDVLLSDTSILSPKEIDVFVPDFKFGIEYNGLFWHSSYNIDTCKDMSKFNICEEKGIKLLMLFEDEWRDKKDLCKSMIKWRLKKFDGIKLNARDLEVRKLNKNKDFEAFFKKNHLEGHVKAKFAYGLYCNNQLVMCASVRKNYNHEFEVARMATDYNYSVRGGGGKLIKAILEDINNEPLISYSNNRLSTGNVYKNLGAIEITKTKKPNYFYTDFKNRYHRFKCKRINDPKILALYPDIPHTEKDQCESGMTARVILGKDIKLYKIEDYGSKKWLLNPTATV